MQLNVLRLWLDDRHLPCGLRAPYRSDKYDREGNLVRRLGIPFNEIYKIWDVIFFAGFPVGKTPYTANRQAVLVWMRVFFCELCRDLTSGVWRGLG